MIEILPYLKDPKLYGNYGIFLIMGNAGIISSTVGEPQHRNPRNAPEQQSELLIERLFREPLNPSSCHNVGAVKGLSKYIYKLPCAIFGGSPLQLQCNLPQNPTLIIMVPY